MPINQKEKHHAQGSREREEAHHREKNPERPRRQNDDQVHQ